MSTAGVSATDIFDFVPALWGTPEEILKELLAPYTRLTWFESGSVVGEPDQKPSHVMIICSGTWIATNKTGTMLVAIRSGGDLTFDGSVITGRADRYVRRALTGSHVLLVRAEDFKRCVDSAPLLKEHWDLEHVAFAEEDPLYKTAMQATTARDRVISVVHNLVRSINFPIFDDGVDPWHWTWFYRPHVARWAGINSRQGEEVSDVVKELISEGILSRTKQGQPVVVLGPGVKKEHILQQLAALIPKYTLPDGPKNGML